MGVMTSIRNTLVNWLLPGYSERAARLAEYSLRHEYREGEQRRPLKVKPEQADDNLILNFTGLIVDRGISMLFGEGVDFDFGEDEVEPAPDGEQEQALAPSDPRSEYIDSVMEANTYPIFLHKIGQLGGTYGTAYAKIMPGALDGGLPRLVALNPQWLTMDTLPEDMETVFRYTIEYNTADENDKAITRKEVTEHLRTVEGWADVWSVKSYIMREGEGRFELVGDVEWPYPFAPIVHWQNLPDAEQCYGDSDITNDMIAIQDAVNFVASNIQRIIRYHAHPKTWGRGFTTSGKASWGADEMVTVNGQDAMIQNLEMSSDLASSREFLHYLRGILFDLSRTVDLSSMTDKLGALTNFALRVLYKDALDKLETKRLLYGWGLSEINRRVLLLAGIDTDTGGEVVWPEPLPIDDVSQAQALQTDLSMGIVDKQTVSTIRGYDWETVEQRLAQESQQGANIGENILRDFQSGGGSSLIEQMMGGNQNGTQGETGQR